MILVDAPLSGVRGFISIFRETISSISMKLFPSRSAHWFWHTNLGICFSIKGKCHLYGYQNSFKTAEYETEADTFAIELLLPDDTFSEYLSAGYTSEQISRITGYAQRLIDLKASHIKIL